MSDEKTYQLLVSKMHEMAIIPPQTMGPFTMLYKRFVPWVKWYPWKSVGAFSIFAASVLYLLFGVKVVKLASLLQFGF